MSFYKVMDTINRMNNKEVEKNPSGKNTQPRVPSAKGTSLNAAKRKWIELPGSCYFA